MPPLTTNVARAVASVHQIGCVIGDINHSGILVSEHATVTLIDADSFQVRFGQSVYRCRVGVGEYTPPELQGVVLDAVDRDPTHDAFGLAVIVFQLLFLGRHPFAGRYGGQGDMPIEKAIKEARFAYSRDRRSETRMDAPPFAPTLLDMPPEIATAFERAFHSNPAMFRCRPSAAEWVSILNRFESQLTLCRADSSHHYAKNAPSCPFCRLENGTGVTLFPRIGAFAPTASRSNFDLNAAMAAIARVLIHGEALDPAQLIAPPTITSKSASAEKSREARMLRCVLGFLLGSLCIGLVINEVPAAALGLLIAAGLILGEGEGRLQLKEARSRAECDWKDAVRDWQQEAGPERFRHKKAELAALATEYKGLCVREESRIKSLDDERRPIQLRRFLEGHLISRAQISGIGNGRKTTLASYGIENAADVIKEKVHAVPGFGEVMTKKVMQWRSSIERKFVFNPSIAVDSDAIRRVTSEFTRRRAEIERTLARGPVDLEQLRTTALSAQSRPTQRLIEALRALRQAEFDLA